MRDPLTLPLTLLAFVKGSSGKTAVKVLPGEFPETGMASVAALAAELEMPKAEARARTEGRMVGGFVCLLRSKALRVAVE